MPRGRKPMPIGTRRIASGGYIRVKVADGHPCAHANRSWALEHRVVMFDAGFPVTVDTHVHHINEIKTDNRLENLEIKDPAKHTIDHAAKRRNALTPEERYQRFREQRRTWERRYRARLRAGLVASQQGKTRA